MGLTSIMASNRPSGDGTAYAMKLLERSRTEALPSSVIKAIAIGCVQNNDRLCSSAGVISATPEAEEPWTGAMKR